MDEEKEGRNNYVYKVLDDTNRYVHGLLSENEELRSLVGEVTAEKRKFEDQLISIQKEMERSREEKSRLQARLAQIESENRQFSGRYIEVEQQNANLANLYVASYRLHSTLDRPEVISIIKEIIINLIGSEELAIFERDPDKTELRLLSSFGIAQDRYNGIRLGEGVIGRVALSGKPYVAEHKADGEASSNEPELTACVPLKLGDATIGVIAIFHLLPQKNGLEPLDYELFDLLGAHAGAALYCTSLHMRLGPVIAG